MEVVIEIPDDAYKKLCSCGYVSSNLNIISAIKSGIPLPKEHGRLKDVDAMLRKHPEFDTYPFPSTTIDNAPTIIEADKAHRSR